MRSHPTFLLLISFFLHLLFLSARGAHSKIRCIEKEKQALLDFKLSFVNGNLSSWSIHNDDCCTWDGVGCDVHTDHVTSLQLDQVDGYKLRPSLLELQYLTSLEISYNDDQSTIRIPKFIGSLSELTYLDLEGFYGEIPPHLGNLSKLQYLWIFPSSNGDSYAHNLKWLSRLSSLEILFLSGTNLTNAIDWASTIKMLPTLTKFGCGSCSLPPPILSSTYQANFSTTLKTLNLFNNSLSSSTISYLINTSNNLQYLYLDHINLVNNDSHKFLETLINKARYSLKELSLVGNNLNDLSFGGMMFPSLTLLYANSNQIRGNLSEILRCLSPNLTHLDLSSNILSGAILDAHLSKFSKLTYLHLSNNLLTINFSEGWVPPFQLVILGLRSCKVGPSFPSWILTQNSLEFLDMSNNMISGSIPDAFWNFSTNLYSFNLSHNKLSCFPDFNLTFSSRFLSFIDLSYNSFHGLVPLALFKSKQELHLSNNKFSNFPTFHQPSPTFSLVQWVIDLSNNNLSGSLPNWLVTYEPYILNLENNKLSGHLPRSIGSQRNLIALHLSNNLFSGQLPLSLQNCTHLKTLELANNKLSGVVPSWLGESMVDLVVLNLRSNDFWGDLSSTLCHLQSLQIMDLSNNKLSGTIPDCLHNFSSMAINHGLSPTFTHYTFHENGIVYQMNFQNFDFASFMWKGALVSLYERNLEQRNAINLSSNLLRGAIPIGVTALKELMSLDLSMNELNGSIPDKIGQLTSLDVLKLSSNRLCGEIPQSLAALTFLGTLNLSNNNLSGRIPTGPQLQLFDPSSFAGNPKLCGQPLTKCPGDKDNDDFNKQPQATNKDARDKDGESFDIQAFLAALGMGFAIGLLGILGSLHFIRPWRLAFFQLVNNILLTKSL